MAQFDDTREICDVWCIVGRSENSVEARAVELLNTATHTLVPSDHLLQPIRLEKLGDDVYSICLASAARGRLKARLGL